MLLLDGVSYKYQPGVLDGGGMLCSMAFFDILSVFKMKQTSDYNCEMSTSPFRFTGLHFTNVSALVFSDSTRLQCLLCRLIFYRYMVISVSGNVIFSNVYLFFYFVFVYLFVCLFVCWEKGDQNQHH